MLADDDVARLDVAVQDAAAVRVLDRVADVDEPPQQLAQLQRAAAGVRLQRLVPMGPLDRVLEAVAADEAHGVEGAAVAVGAQAVDRHDPRMLQPAGDLGFEYEALSAGRVVGVAVEDLLQGHLAVQLGVQRHEHGAEAAPGVRPEDAESLTVGGRRADGVGGGAVGVGLGRAGADVGEGGLDLGVAQAGQSLAGGAAGGDGGQARLRVAAMLLQVQGYHRLDAGALLDVEVAATDEVIGQRTALVAGPSLEGGDQGPLIDQADLQRQQAE